MDRHPEAAAYITRQRGPCIAHERIPSPTAPHVPAFAQEVAPASKPVIVRSSPRFDREMNECFPLVEKQIEASVGSMAIGWSIWEWPAVFIEAEFHAVWSSPHGELYPRPVLLEKIVFLQDPSRRYRGRQLDNVRKPLMQDNDLTRFLYIFTRRFQILNEGDRAGQHAVALAPRELRELQKLGKEMASLERRLQGRYGTSD